MVLCYVRTCPLLGVAVAVFFGAVSDGVTVGELHQNSWGSLQTPESVAMERLDNSLAVQLLKRHSSRG